MAHKKFTYKLIIIILWLISAYGTGSRVRPKYIWGTSYVCLDFFPYSFNSGGRIIQFFLTVC